MPDSILFMEIGICLLIEALISGKCIADATFYSRCFEGDLDGYLEFDGIAQVIVKRTFFVKLQLLIFSCIYMKNYDIKTVDGKEKVVLRSKTVTCQCQSCGATLEKKIYFTGECPYCGSSDSRCSQRPVPVQLLRKYDNGRHRQKDLNNNKRQSTAFGLYFFGRRK